MTNGILSKSFFTYTDSFPVRFYLHQNKLKGICVKSINYIDSRFQKQSI